MNKISSNSSTNEIAEACQGIIELSKKYPIEGDTYYSLTFEKMTEKLNALIGKINSGWLNSELKEKDDARDLDVRAIFYEVSAKCMRRPSADQEKALRIKTVLDRYGLKITEDSYTLESAEIRAMLSDLKLVELEDSLASIPGFKKLIENTEESMAAFDLAALQLIEDKNERKNAKTATAIAVELKSIINDELLVYLAGMAKAKSMEFKPFVNVVNTLIKNSNGKVRDRLATLKRKKEKINSELN